MLISLILIIMSFISLVGFILAGADENFLQFVGNLGGMIPVVGIWFNAISAFTKETLQNSIGQNAVMVFDMLLKCLMSNLLDTVFLGLIYSLCKQVLGLSRHGLWSRGLDFGAMLFSTAIGVCFLAWMKQYGDQFYAVAVSGGSILIMIVAILIMMNTRLAGFNLYFFLFDVISGAFEAGGSIGLICSMLLLPSLLKKGIPLGAGLLWIATLIGFILVIHYVSVAKDALE